MSAGWKRTQRLQGEQLSDLQSDFILLMWLYVYVYVYVIALKAHGCIVPLSLFPRETKVKGDGMELMDARWVTHPNVQTIQLWLSDCLSFFCLFGQVVWRHVPLVFLIRVKLVTLVYPAVKDLLEQTWVVFLNPKRIIPLLGSLHHLVGVGRLISKISILLMLICFEYCF